MLDDLLATCTVDRSTADARAAACAEAQYGLLTYGQARRAGISDTALARRVAAGRWRRVRTGVYVTGGAPPLWRQQVLAAVLAVDELAASGRPLGAEPGRGSHALAAGATAAYLLGLPGAARPPRPQVAVAAPWRVRLEDVDGVQLGDLRGEDRDRAHGIPCLSPVRAALEVVQGLHGEVTVTGFVDDLLCSGVERTDLHRRAAQLWPGRRHVALVRKLTAPGAEDVFRSRLERDAVAALDRAGVPARRVNAVVHDRVGARIREVDLLWPEAQLVVELDGLRIAAEIDRLNPDEVVVLGGEAVVSRAVETALASRSGSGGQPSGSAAKAAAAPSPISPLRAAQVAALATGGGSWVSPEEALARVASLPRARELQLYCLLPRE